MPVLKTDDNEDEKEEGATPTAAEGAQPNHCEESEAAPGTENTASSEDDERNEAVEKEGEIVNNISTKEEKVTNQDPRNDSESSSKSEKTGSKGTTLTNIEDYVREEEDEEIVFHDEANDQQDEEETFSIDEPDAKTLNKIRDFKPSLDRESSNSIHNSENSAENKNRKIASDSTRKERGIEEEKREIGFDNYDDEEELSNEFDELNEIIASVTRPENDGKAEDNDTNERKTSDIENQKTKVSPQKIQAKAKPQKPPGPPSVAQIAKLPTKQSNNNNKNTNNANNSTTAQNVKDDDSDEYTYETVDENLTKWVKALGIGGLLACLVIIGLLVGVLWFLLNDNNDSNPESFATTTTNPPAITNNPTISPTIDFNRTPRGFLGTFDDVTRFCGIEFGYRITRESALQVFRWNVAISESICCSDWTDMECHSLGLKCSTCTSTNFETTNQCDLFRQQLSETSCNALQTLTVSNLIDRCNNALGTVKVNEILLLHDERPQKGLAASCQLPSSALELVDSSLQIGLLCGACRGTYGTVNYMQKEDCRQLDPNYPKCNGGDAGYGVIQGAAMISNENIDDLLTLCGREDLEYKRVRVHPEKYGPGTEVELIASCASWYANLFPLYGVVCGYCEGTTFVPTGDCDGRAPILLRDSAQCDLYLQTDLSAECSPGDGYASTIPWLGEFKGELTRGRLVCCSSSNCPDGTIINGIFCGECTGPDWEDYIPYRDCGNITSRLETC